MIIPSDIKIGNVITYGGSQFLIVKDMNDGRLRLLNLYCSYMISDYFIDLHDVDNACRVFNYIEGSSVCSFEEYKKHGKPSYYE